MKKQQKFFACVIKQYGSGQYRSCVYLDEKNLLYLGAHLTEAGANETMNRFLDAQAEGSIQTEQDVAVFVASLTASEPPALAMAA